MEKPFLSVRETTSLLGISRSYFYQLLNQNAFMTCKLGKRRMIDASSLREWVAKLPAYQTTIAERG